MPNKPLQPTPLRGAAELARWVDASRRPIGARLSPRFGSRSAAHQRGSTRLRRAKLRLPRLAG